MNTPYFSLRLNTCHYITAESEIWLLAAYFSRANASKHAQEHRWEDVPHDVSVQEDVGHARHETRRCTTVNLSDLGGRRADAQQLWKGLASLIRIESTRIVGDKTTQDTRYFLSSLTAERSKPSKRRVRMGAWRTACTMS